MYRQWMKLGSTALGMNELVTTCVYLPYTVCCIQMTPRHWKLPISTWTGLLVIHLGKSEAVNMTRCRCPTVLLACPQLLTFFITPLVLKRENFILRESERPLQDTLNALKLPHGESSTCRITYLTIVLVYSLEHLLLML